MGDVQESRNSGLFGKLAGVLIRNRNLGAIAPGQEAIMEDYAIGPTYKDRQEAGAELAEKLLPYRQARPVVIAIPNGGVAVAVPIAKKLACPLHLMVVRKLQIPDNPEAGFGAVASDGTLLLNVPLVQRLGFSEAIIARQKQKALKTIQARLCAMAELRSSHS